MHWHNRRDNLHLEFLNRAKFDLKKMFTPPKSKSPWEAMTAGSTGGWAAGLQKFGPVLNAALGAIPVIGPAAAAIGGMAGMSGGGFQGTDKGASNILSTALGGLSGYGMGTIGSGVGAGLKSFASGTGFMSGFGKGATGYLNTPIIPGISGSSGTGIAKGIGSVLSPAGSTTTSGSGATGVLNTIASNADKGIIGTTGATGGTSSFNLSNISKLVLGGAGAFLAGSMTPQLQANPAEAKAAINSPNLVEARNMIRDLALAKPEELLSPASDEFVQASLRQSRDAARRAREEVINTYSARGAVVGKSSAVDSRLAAFDKEQVQREQDWIVGVNEARQTAAIGQKIKLVQEYYRVSADEAANMLAAEGYVNPVDAQNYLANMAAYNSSIQLAGLAVLR
jgi:hypothetical protein